MAVPNATITKNVALSQDGWRRTAYPGGSIPSAGSPWVNGQPPVPSSVSGTFAQGSQLTIIGTNFSANRSGQFFFKSFDGGQIGQDAATEFAKPGNTYLYSGDSTPANKATVARYDVNNQSMNSTRLIFGGGGFSECWMHCDMRIDAPDLVSAEGSGEQIKLFRLVAGEADIHDAAPYHGVIWEAVQSWLQTWNSVDVEAGTIKALSPGAAGSLTGQWARWSLAWGASSAGLYDGYAMAKNWLTDDPKNSSNDYFNDPSEIYANKSWKLGDRLTVKSGYTHQTLGQLFLPFYHRSDQHTIISLSNLWVNDSPEQVIFGDAATLETCTTSKLINQPMLSRNSTMVAVSCEEGPNDELAVGPVYAFVFNKDGIYNETGIQVRAG